MLERLKASQNNWAFKMDAVDTLLCTRVSQRVSLRVLLSNVSYCQVIKTAGKIGVVMVRQKA